MGIIASVEEWWDKRQAAREKAILADVRIYVGAPGHEPLLTQNSEELNDPASLSKLQTLYNVLKHGKNVPKTVTISEHAMQYKMNTGNVLKKGDKLPLETALMAMIIHSDNIAAAAIGETFGEGNTPSDRHRAFVLEMNKTAQDDPDKGGLGMKKTIYTSSSGMVPNALYPNRDQTNEEANTTAADMAKLITALYHDFPDDAPRYLETPTVTYKGATHNAHTNLLIRKTPSFFDTVRANIMAKTGLTDRAGYNLASLAHSPDGRELVVVIMRVRDTAIQQALELVEKKIMPPPIWKGGRLVTKGNRMVDALANTIFAAWAANPPTLKTLDAEFPEISPLSKIDLTPLKLDQLELSLPKLAELPIIPPLTTPARPAWAAKSDRQPTLQ